jgi:hypothetical protein
MPAGDPIFAYRCYDAQQCDPISVLPFVNVAFGQTVSKDDTFTADLYLDDPRMARLAWERSTRPDYSAMFIDVGSPDGFCPWGGICTARKYASKEKKLSVTYTTWGQYMKQRLQARDYTKPPTAPPDTPYWSANPADPCAIAAQVVYDALVSSLTMVSLSDFFCNVCTGVQIQVNGNPPPSVTGCTPYSILQSGSVVVYCFGLNACATNGSDIDDGGSVIPGGTTIVPGTVVTHSHHGATPNNASITSYVTSSDVLHGVSSPYPLAVGMLADCPGFAVGTTVAALGSVSIVGGFWVYTTVTLSNTCSAGHTSVTGTIGGYFTLHMSAAATGLAREDVNIANGNASGLTPIDGQYAKTQFQTVDSIYTGLAMMGYGSGFDYSWDVMFQEGSTRPLVFFNMFTPRKGRLWPDSGVVVDLEQATEWNYTEDALSQAIGLVESGTGSGGTITTVESRSGLVTGDGYLPVELTKSHTEINSLDQLQEIAIGELGAVVWPVSTLVVTLPLILHEPEPGEPNPPGIRIAALNTGDDVKVVVGVGNLPVAGLPIDPRWPNGLNFIFELQAWRATIAPSGVSTVEMTFGVPPSEMTGTMLPPRPPYA